MRYTPYDPYGYQYSGLLNNFGQTATLGGAFSPNITSFGQPYGAPSGQAGLPFGYPQAAATHVPYTGAPVQPTQPAATHVPYTGAPIQPTQAAATHVPYTGAPVQPTQPAMGLPYEGAGATGLFPPQTVEAEQPDYDFGGRYFNRGKFGKKGRRRIKELGYGGAKEFLAENPDFASRGVRSQTGLFSR